MSTLFLYGCVIGFWMCLRSIMKILARKDLKWSKTLEKLLIAPTAVFVLLVGGVYLLLRTLLELVWLITPFYIFHRIIRLHR